MNGLEHGWYKNKLKPMTPKEKADKLCMRFLIQTTTDIPYGINKTIAKECALIAVDEILQSLGYKKLSDSPYTTLEARQYYVEVKQEINKLQIWKQNGIQSHLMKVTGYA